MNLIAILKGICGIYNFAPDQHGVIQCFESQNDSQNFIHCDRGIKFKRHRRMPEPAWNDFF